MSIDATTSVFPVASLRSRFQSGIAYTTIGAVFNQGSTFAVNIIVANLLGRQVFGEYAMVQSTLATLALMAQLAVGYTATKYIAEFRSTDPQRAGRILGMLIAFSASVAGIVVLALLSVSGWLAGSVLKTPALGTTLAIGSGVLLFAVLNGLLMGALIGLESYPSLARALVWSGLEYLAVCTGLARWGGLNGAVAGMAISGLFQFILLASALRKECALQGIKIHYAGITQERSILLKFALPGAMSGFTSMPALWLASAFLVRQPNGYSQMALYSAAYTLMTAVLFLPGITNNVGMSLINHQKGRRDWRQYRRTFWINLVMTVGIVIVGAGIFAVLGPRLLRLFGKSFFDGYSVLVVLMAAAIPEGLTVAMNQVIQSQGKMWLAVFAINLPRDATILLVAVWLAPSHGALGLATGYLSGRLLAFIVMSVLVLRIGFALPSQGNANLPAAAASAVCDPARIATAAPVIGCPLCRSTDCSTSNTFSEMLDLPDHTCARVAVCARCRFKFLHPHVSEEFLAQMYSEAYFTGQCLRCAAWPAPGSGENYDATERARLPKFRSSLELLFRYVDSPRNLLDVGAATGGFLALARQKGLSVSGIELSPYAAELARMRCGLDLSVCRLEDFVTEERFDIVHLNHVLEHFVEPHQAVARIERLLSQKGAVYVEVPYQFNWVETLKYRFLGSKLPFNVHSIHHPVFFDPETLVRLFAMHHLNVLHMRLFDPDRYLTATPMQSAKRLAWTALAHLQQGMFIEAVFARSERGCASY